MNRQKKQLLTLMTLLAFLLIGYLSLESYNISEERKEEANTIVITEFEADDVTAFSYDYNGVTYSYTRNDEEWSYDGNDILDMDESLIDSMLNIAGSLLGEDMASEYESLDTYGLDDPIKTIVITMTDGTQSTIKVGNYNEILGFYYLMVEDDNNLYLVDSSIFDTFEISNTSLEYVEEETEEVTETE